MIGAYSHSKHRVAAPGGRAALYSAVSYVIRRPLTAIRSLLQSSARTGEKERKKIFSIAGRSCASESQPVTLFSAPVALANPGNKLGTNQMAFRCISNVCFDCSLSLPAEPAESFNGDHHSPAWSPGCRTLIKPTEKLKSQQQKNGRFLHSHFSGGWMCDPKLQNFLGSAGCRLSPGRLLRTTQSAEVVRPIHDGDQRSAVRCLGDSWSAKCRRSGRCEIDYPTVGQWPSVSLTA